MRLITSIISFINTNEFLEEINASKKLTNLFMHIVDGRIKSDEDGWKVLAIGQEQRDGYKQLRLRLQSKLINYVVRHGMDTTKIDRYTNEFHKCITKVALTRMLLMNNEREASVALAEQVLKVTMKYGFTELSMMLCRDLYQYYGIIAYDLKKMEKYNKIYSEVRELFRKELDAHRYYCELRAEFLYTMGSKGIGAIALANEYSKRLREYGKTGMKSYQLLMHSYNVYAMQAEMEPDYEKLVKICNEAVKQFNKLPIQRRAGILAFDMYKLVAFIQLRRYHDVEKISNKYLVIIRKGTLNWIVVCLYLIISRLHWKKYNEAYQLIDQYDLESTTRKQPVHICEVWKVLEAHVQYLVAIGKIQTDEPSTFRLNKFLNEIPLYSKDKRGLNIAILIIQFLFLLQQRKYSKIIDRAEALQLYCYRYLRKDDTFRSHCFIRMLLMMPKADFNRVRTERYAEPYLKKLKSVPLKVSQQTIEVEVIPYEDLWEMSLPLLD